MNRLFRGLRLTIAYATFIRETKCTHIALLVTMRKGKMFRLADRSGGNILMKEMSAPYPLYVGIF
jgi:hypothetical protein